MSSSFNEAELLERVDNDRAFLRETIAMLESDAPTLLSDLRRAMEAGDGPAVGRAAHALKGMVSNFCAPAAQARALEVERMGKSGDLSGAPAAVAALEADVTTLTGDLLRFAQAVS